MGAPTVTGRRISLSEGRSVFLGRSEQEPDLHFIAFRNAEGVDTRLKISEEAMTALITLINWRKDRPTDPLLAKRVWALFDTVTSEDPTNA